MEIIKSSLAFIDLFQCPINLLFNSNEKISTTTSKILSILIYFLLIFSFFQSDMWNKKNPKIFDQMVANEETQIFLDRSNFGIILNLQDEGGIPIGFDPSYISVEVANHWESTEKSSKVDINMELCQNSNFESQNSSMSLCPGCLCMSNDSHIDINMTERTWMDFSYISIIVKICSNDTAKNLTCHPLEDILEYVNGKYFSLTFQEYFFDMNDFNNPAKPNFQTSKEVFINKNFYQYSSISLMEVVLLQDNNYVFESENLLNAYFQQDASQYFSNFYFQPDEEIIQKNYTSLIEFQISPSLNKRIITRKYQKLTEVFSMIGGLATIFRFLGGSAANFFRSLNILQTVTKKNIRKEKKNHKFETKIDDDPKKLDKTFSGIINENNQINVNISNFSNSIELLTRNQRDREMEGKNCNGESQRIEILTKNVQNDEKPPPEIELMDSQRMPPKKIKKSILALSPISFCGYIKYLVFQALNISFDENCQNIDRVRKSYQKEFDVLFFIKYFREFKKMKYFLLDEKQKQIFDSLNMTLSIKNANTIAEPLY